MYPLRKAQEVEGQKDSRMERRKVGRMERMGRRKERRKKSFGFLYSRVKDFLLDVPLMVVLRLIDGVGDGPPGNHFF